MGSCETSERGAAVNSRISLGEVRRLQAQRACSFPRHLVSDRAGREGGAGGMCERSPCAGLPEIRLHPRLPSQAGPGRENDPRQQEGTLPTPSPRDRCGRTANQACATCSECGGARGVTQTTQATCTLETHARGNTRYLDLISERDLQGVTCFRNFHLFLHFTLVLLAPFILGRRTSYTQICLRTLWHKTSLFWTSPRLGGGFSVLCCVSGYLHL